MRKMNKKLTKINNYKYKDKDKVISHSNQHQTIIIINKTSQLIINNLIIHNLIISLILLLLILCQ